MDQALTQAIQEAISQKKSLRIQYYSDIHEFLTVTALIKQVQETQDGPVVELATGQLIPFGQLVRVGTVAADKYGPEFFQCGL